MHDYELDLVFKALAHGERRRILISLLENHDQSLFEICAASCAQKGQTLSRRTISQHLEMFQRAGLLEVKWQGRTKKHSIKQAPLRKTLDTLSGQFF